MVRYRCVPCRANPLLTVTSIRSYGRCACFCARARMHTAGLDLYVRVLIVTANQGK